MCTMILIGSNAWDGAIFIPKNNVFERTFATHSDDKMYLKMLLVYLFPGTIRLIKTNAPANNLQINRMSNEWTTFGTLDERGTFLFILLRWSPKASPVFI